MVNEDREFIERYFKEAGGVLEKISREEVKEVIEVLFHAWQSRSHIYTCGNGGSASTAAHFAADLVKTVASEGKRGLKAECLNNEPALMTAIINDEGFENLFYSQLKTKFEPGDVLICIFVHGGAGKDKALRLK